jgi:hypothetical protein
MRASKLQRGLIMKLKKTEIVEYVLAFIGIVGLLTYIHVTTVAYQSVGAVQISPMMIEAGWTLRADAGRSAVRLREVAPTDVRV